MSQSQPSHRFILSGGGTGGHIFPALAIADAIRQREPGASILFIGARHRMEMEKVPAAGYTIKGLWISGLQRKLTVRNLLFPLKLVSSLVKAGFIVKQFKPDVVIGTGGFASGPTLRMASLFGIPTLIQEQNSYPGITNRMLAGKADRICVAYEGLERYFPKNRIVITGNPVRKDLLSLHERVKEALSFFKLEKDRKTVLMIGGSLGALSLNEGMRLCSSKLQERSIQVIWQTGKSYYPIAKSHCEQQNLTNVHVFDFIHRMDLAYAAADIIVSRAGAIAISELCIASKPCILIPSPNVAEDHQTKNAKALTERGAALLLPDNETREKLGDMVLETLENTEIRVRLSDTLHTMARPDATEHIADEVFKLIRTDR